MKKVILFTVICLLLVSMVFSFSMIGCKTTDATGTTGATETTSAAETTAAGAETTAAAGEKPNLIFWQNEAGSGLSQWYADVVADINANEDFTVKLLKIL